MPQKLYLVDGMSHIYRAYHAIQALTNKKGLPTNAIYGFTTMIRKLIHEEEPEYIGVAIDLVGPTVRHVQYVDYKSTRRPMPEDLAQQIPYIWRVCEVLRLPILSHEGYEADDVIGTLARKAVESGLDVVIVTIDKDMFQLVNQHVTLLDTRTMLRLDPAGVEEKFGLPPEKVVDALALIGDTSDNIPGAPSIGDKGAKQLIQEFGDLENLLAKRDQISRRTYRESLQQNEALIRKSHELLTIHQDLPLELDLAKLRSAEPERAAALELFSELEFTSIVAEFLPEKQTLCTDYTCVEDIALLEQLAADLSGGVASLVLEFPSGKYMESPLEAISVSRQPHQAFSILSETLERFPEHIVKLLKSPAQWVVHDLKPFYFFAERYGWPSDLQFVDNMLVSYLLMPNQNNYSLEKLGLEYLQHQLQPSSETAGSGLFSRHFVESCCERADILLRLHQILFPRLEEKNLQKLLHEIEIPLVEVLAAMECEGVKVDCDLLQKMSAEMDLEIRTLTESIYSLAGGEFNINSPKQLGTVLFEKLNLPLSKKTRKAGHLATGVEVLEELANSYEIARLILEYRELTKLKGTYLDSLPKLVNPRTGRIHTSYNQMVAATGRLSSSNPNLQNIPVKKEVGRRIRRAFIAERGCKLLAADYSQIELRVMAHLSGDPVLTQAFLQGEDIHERTAREVFGFSAEADPHEYRRRAKVINFGIMYGLSAFGLAQSLKIGRAEAQVFIDNYFEKYQGVKNWIDQTLSAAARDGHVTTLFGRIRQIPEIHSKNWNLRALAERTAINAPIQGTAADLIKKAMVEIFRDIKNRRLRSKLILQVHDELVLEVPEEELEEVNALVVQRMEGAAALSVPLKVDLGVGDSWLDAK
ncbi:MAG: DNA polymerase I [Acidobacteria bacterium]|nr:DNA polymerase I [Acidobacteriota bacterium]